MRIYLFEKISDVNSTCYLFIGFNLKKISEIWVYFEFFHRLLHYLSGFLPLCGFLLITDLLIPL
jgi:hypothetical protein